MGPLAIVLVLALSLFGCGSAAPSGDPVRLLTGELMVRFPPGVTPGPMTPVACDTLSSSVGLLVADSNYGTALIHESNLGERLPVMWQSGFTGRQVGAEVVVLDVAGGEVATTGQRYRMYGGVRSDDSVGPVFAACTPVVPE